MNKIVNKEFRYHGNRMKKPYFEGWYYRITSDVFSLAIIVGINKNTGEDHGFIQILDTISEKEQYLSFPLSKVHIQEHPFLVQMGNNYFYQDRWILNIETEIPMKIDCIGKDFEYLASTWYAPTIMGPFAYIPNMECVHTVSSLYHHVSGLVKIHDTEVDITNAIGYIEKDRGTSFPNAYFWLQTNHFINTKASLFLSIASIPLRCIHFTGIIMVLLIEKKQLRFGSYYGAKVKVIKKIEKGYKIIIKQGKYLLCIKVDIGKTFDLSAPIHGKMKTMVQETLSATGRLHLYEKNRLLLTTSFKNAGCEVRGY